MGAPRSNNRQMFWRILRRLLGANHGRLFVILLALGAGAAVTAALLNLQVDAKHRITSEFRAFGPNVLVLPRNASSSGFPTLAESIAHSIPVNTASGRVAVSSSLYVVAKVSAPQSGKSLSAVISGTSPLFLLKISFNPAAGRADASGAIPPSTTDRECVVGSDVARQLGVQQDAGLVVSYQDRQEACSLATLRETGGPEDDRVKLDLRTAQQLAALPGRISVFELIVPGTPAEIQGYISNLQRILPDVEVRPVRQFTDAQAKIYTRISGILNFTVGFVLVLTALCVMAAMANVAVERRNDVALMKAIGGAKRRVLRFFLTEAALLGVAGGLIGSAVGILFSIWLGKQVFGVAAQPRLIVYPIAVALTTLVAILSAYPLRHLAGVRPAAVFRGEG